MPDVPPWFFDQSAVIPYRRGDDGLEILLITTKSGRWIIPKGVIDPGETPEHSAAREAEEEAGIRGEVHDGIVGTYTNDKWGGTCTIRVFAMKVTKELKTWPEMGFRKRDWLRLEKAAKRVARDDVATIIRALPAFLSDR
jgi:phosphohistidine phosphatase